MSDAIDTPQCVNRSHASVQGLANLLLHSGANGGLSLPRLQRSRAGGRGGGGEVSGAPLAAAVPECSRKLEGASEA